VCWLWRCHICAGCGRLYTALDVRTAMSEIVEQTDTNPVRPPRSTPCITCNAAIVFSLRETANSARVAPLRDTADAIVCSPLPLYVVFGADAFCDASVGIMRRPACVMTATAVCGETRPTFAAQRAVLSHLRTASPHHPLLMPTPSAVYTRLLAANHGGVLSKVGQARQAGSVSSRQFSWERIIVLVNVHVLVHDLTFAFTSSCTYNVYRCAMNGYDLPAR
jgi:hypothetical protein